MKTIKGNTMERINKLVIVLILGIVASNVYSQGKQVDDNFFSTSLDTIRDLRVYLPDGYDSMDINKRYPVMYFLHGSGGNHTSYDGIYPILDSLMSPV